MAHMFISAIQMATDGANVEVRGQEEPGWSCWLSSCCEEDRMQSILKEVQSRMWLLKHELLKDLSLSDELNALLNHQKWANDGNPGHRALYLLVQSMYVHSHLLSLLVMLGCSFSAINVPSFTFIFSAVVMLFTSIHTLSSKASDITGYTRWWCLTTWFAFLVVLLQAAFQIPFIPHSERLDGWARVFSVCTLVNHQLGQEQFFTGIVFVVVSLQVRPASKLPMFPNFSPDHS